MTTRPPCIVSPSDVAERQWGPYPKSDEPMGIGREIGKAAGLQKIGIHLLRLPPGRRTSWPHCESKEEEFVYVVDGELEAWIDGNVYPIKTGDLVGFPAGTGICHTVINNSNREALLLSGGETNKADNQIRYPHHPSRKDDLKPEEWWNDGPKPPLGPHDGRPDALARQSPDSK